MTLLFIVLGCLGYLVMGVGTYMLAEGIGRLPYITFTRFDLWMAGILWPTFLLLAALYIVVPPKDRFKED